MSIWRIVPDRAMTRPAVSSRRDSESITLQRCWAMIGLLVQDGITGSGVPFIENNGAADVIVWSESQCTGGANAGATGAEAL